MRITFKTIEQAKAFIESDTRFDIGILRASQKNWHRDVRLIQCKVCRKIGHRKGHRSCDRIQKCPRCLSTSHSQPTDTCRPMCSIHGDGHSNGSDRCPNNIKFRKEQRTAFNINDRINRQTANTAPDYRQIHHDVLTLRQEIKNNNSYASAVQNKKTNLPTPTPTGIIPIQNKNFDSTTYASSYISACISEAYDPGCFQEVMDAYAELNGLPKIKHPPPRPTLLKALAPEAPILPNSDSVPDAVSKIPQTQTVTDYDDDDRPPEHIHSPANIKKRLDKALEIKVEKIIEKTKEIPFEIKITRTRNLTRDRELASTITNESNQMDLEELNYYCKDGSIFYDAEQFSKPVNNPLLRLSYVNLEDAAINVKLKNRFLYVRVSLQE